MVPLAPKAVTEEVTNASVLAELAEEVVSAICRASKAATFRVVVPAVPSTVG